MKIVVAIEGVDGSGKTCLARHISELCADHNCPCTLVGRQHGLVSPAVVKLGQLIRDEIRNLSPQADLFIRLAREYQRAHLAAAVPEGVVVLDRFVLTVLSLARLYGQDVELLKPFLHDVATRASLGATILVQCPFEVARLRARHRGSSPADSMTRCDVLLRRVAESVAADFAEGSLTGRQWPVDNSGSLAHCTRLVDQYLQPYLQVPSASSA